MKKLLISLVSFLMLTVVVYVLLTWIAGNAAPMYLRKNLSYRAGAYGHMNSRMKDVKASGPVDVLILGSSHAYRGFDPRFFAERGYKTFNLGSSSQTPIQTKVLLEKYLDHLKPRIVIFEVYPEIFCLDGVESSLDILANDDINWPVVRMVTRINHLKTYNAFIYSWLRQVYGNKDDFIEPVRTFDDTYIKGGYVERRLSFYKDTIHPPSTLIFLPDQWKAFDESLELIRKSNARLILVQAPVTKGYYQSITNSNEADSLLRLKGEYHNFNTLVSLDDSLHFYDPDHLNQEGVKLFNEKLIQILQKP